MTAQDYSVQFGFKAQDGEFYGPNGSIGLYHLGEDLYTPTGTEFIVCGVRLGLTGSTGNVGGPHLHVAKWKAGQHSDGYFVAKYNRTYYKATPSVWTAEGVVTELSHVNVGDAGKFVRWRAVDGFTYEGFHLSSVDVQIGQEIKGGYDMASDDIIKLIIKHLLYRDATDGDVKAYRGWSVEAVFRDVSATPERNDRIIERQRLLATGGASDPKTIEEASKYRQLKQLLS